MGMDMNEAIRQFETIYNITQGVKRCSIYTPLSDCPNPFRCTVHDLVAHLTTKTD